MYIKKEEREGGGDDTSKLWIRHTLSPTNKINRKTNRSKERTCGVKAKSSFNVAPVANATEAKFEVINGLHKLAGN